MLFRYNTLIALASKLNVDITFILSTLACLGTATMSHVASVKEPNKERGGGREECTSPDPGFWLLQLR